MKYTYLSASELLRELPKTELEIALHSELEKYENYANEVQTLLTLANRELATLITEDGEATELGEFVEKLENIAIEMFGE